MAAQPLWLKLVLRLERAVGGPVEAAVHSDTYFDVVAELNRGTRRLTDAVEGVSKRGLHLLNLPAGTDIRRVREQLARMDRRLLQISKELEQLERTRDGSGSERGAAAEPGGPARAREPGRGAVVPASAQRAPLRARKQPAEARNDAQGRRLAARQGAALALSQRPPPATPSRC